MLTGHATRHVRQNFHLPFSKINLVMTCHATRHVRQNVHLPFSKINLVMTCHVRKIKLVVNELMDFMPRLVYCLDRINNIK